MTTSWAATQKPEAAKTGEQSEQAVASQKITAYYMGPACEHNWSKLADDLQTMGAEGKTIWKCSGCEEIAITYDWQTPAG